MKINKKCKKDGHKYNWNECGYGGGPDADVYCDRCKRYVLIPVEQYRQKVPYLYNLWAVSQIDPENEIFKQFKLVEK